jgi:predicted secreted protein
MRRAILAVFLTGLALHAQEGRISGPVAATFFDEATGSLRAINGVPGAGYLSRALASVERAAVSPDGRWALLSSEGKVALLDLSNGASELVAEGDGSLFAWSADSTMAAFVRDGALQIWKREGNTLREAGAAPGGVTRLALDGRTESIFVASADGIARYREGEAMMTLAPVTDAAGLVLDAEGKLLYTVSHRERQLLEIDARNGGAVLFARDAVNPVGVALTQDGSLLVADAESKAVLRYGRMSRALVSTLELGFSPSRLESIGEGIFVLNQRSKQEPLEVVALQPELAAYFVPAPEEN